MVAATVWAQDVAAVAAPDGGLNKTTIASLVSMLSAYALGWLVKKTPKLNSGHIPKLAPVVGGIVMALLSWLLWKDLSASGFFNIAISGIIAGFAATGFNEIKRAPQRKPAKGG